MDDNKKEAVRKEAQDILKKFGKALSKVKLHEGEQRRENGGFRKEGAGNAGDNGFRARMFENASSKDEDCIIAEKKSW